MQFWKPLRNFIITLLLLLQLDHHQLLSLLLHTLQILCSWVVSKHVQRNHHHPLHKLHPLFEYFGEQRVQDL